MNILLHTWEFSKYRGSEFSVSYNYVKEMSKYHKLYITVESNTYEPNDLTEMAEYLDMNNCEFITVGSDLYMRICYRIRLLLPNYLKSLFKYVFLKRWEKRLYKKIKKSDLIEKIDLIHFLGPAGWHEPGYLWKFNKPYIWGPTCGFENTNEVLLKHFFATKYYVYFKSFLNNLSFKGSFRLKRVVKKADCIIAANKSNQRILQEKFKTNNITYFPENLMRISSNEILTESYIVNKYSNIEKLNIIWCGNINPGKMPNLLLDSLRFVKNTEKINVVVIGSGYGCIPESAKDLPFVKFTGRIKRDEVDEYWKTSHLHIITSALEANSTVIFEAMENCVPTMTTNICGMADIVKYNSGIKIDVSSYYDVCVNMACAIDGIVENPTLLREMALNLRKDSFNYVKDKRIEFYNNLYMELAKE